MSKSKERPMSMSFEVGRTQLDDEYHPGSWYAIYYDESPEDHGEIAEFSGNEEVINKMSYWGIETPEQTEIWNKMLHHLKAVFGQEFEPKFPHQK